jgi:hypothetical protein
MYKCFSFLPRKDRMLLILQEISQETERNTYKHLPAGKSIRIGK